MSDSGPTFNLLPSPELVEYGLEKAKRLFGKDFEAVELAKWFKGLQESAVTQTASVYCVGMRKPLPFDGLYQPNRLIVGQDPSEIEPTESYAWNDRASLSILRARAMAEKSITADEFLKRDQDALIFGGREWLHQQSGDFRHLQHTSATADH